MRISGAISGLDTETLVTQLMALERGPVTQLQTKRNSITKQQEAWRTLNTRLHELETKLDALRSTTLWQRTSAVSANTAVLSVTGQGGTAGAYNVTVTALAKAHSVGSASHADPNVALGLAGAPAINGQAVTIAAEDTLTTIAAKINNSSTTGVAASVVQVAPADYRLVLTSKTSGAGGEIALTDDGGTLAALGLTDAGGQPNTVQPAQDAQLSINGLAMTRATNTITDAVPGVTVRLAATGDSVVTVAEDTTAMATAVKDFVTAYNSVVDFIKSQMTHTPSEGGTVIAPPPLYGDSMLRQLSATMRQLVSDPVEGQPAEFGSLWQLGITTGAKGSETARDGKFVVDEAKLLGALDSDLENVKGLFGAGTATGVADRITDYVESYTRSATGFVATRTSSLDRQYRQLGLQLDAAELRLEKREDSLRRQFTAMEQALSRIQSQSNWLNSQLASLTANNQSGNR